MFVRTYMTQDPVFVSPEDTFPQAMNVMRKRKIRHLPVLESGKLVGVVVEKDLLTNQPSPATTLSLYEIYSLLETLRIRKIMSAPVITVEGDCPLEEAARIMAENKISCLPVMQGEDLVGIVTETDVFKVLVEILGGKEQGLRLTLRIAERVGELARITAGIASAGGNILALTTSRVLEDGRREVTIKETGADRQEMVRFLESGDFEVLDVQPTERYQAKLFG